MPWTSWQVLTSFSNAARSGGSDWTNPSNAGASDNSYATSATLTGTSTNYLVGTAADMSEIPSGATITGFKVRFERKQNNGIDGGISTAWVRPVKGGVVAGTEQTVSASWPLSDALSAEIGGSGNLMGATFTESEAKDSGTGVAIACRDDAGSGTVGSIDVIEIAFEYTVASTRRRTALIVG